MQRTLAAFAAGIIFGGGLTISRMIDPGKVLGFLDLAGDWDPSLAFVMLGAVPVAALGFRIARIRPAPLLDKGYSLPARGAIDRRLMLGAALFGAGWGLVGYCPGPALASLGLGHGETVVFVIAMLCGMAGFRAWEAFRLSCLASASLST